MAEKMLVTQALDERDLMAKKIHDKIRKANFTDSVKNNEEKVAENQITREEFRKQAEAAYQQITDWIRRYQKLDEAIILSNARTWIETSQGRFTVAGAISCRDRLRQKNRRSQRTPTELLMETLEEGERTERDFEKALSDKLKSEYVKASGMAMSKNKVLQETADNMRISILGKENQTKDDTAIKVVQTYIQENTTEIVDPLDVVNKANLIDDRRATLLTELETAIKVSNATTFIEI